MQQTLCGEGELNYDYVKQRNDTPFPVERFHGVGHM